MALRCELLHDPKRGPGHGLLKVAPLTPAPAVVRFSLMRNQGGNRYLGPEGQWRATSYEHRASAEASEGGVSVTLGPWFVDAIIEQSPAVLYQLSVTLATGKQDGSLRVNRQRLLGSKAESKTPRKPLAAPPAAVARAEPEIHIAPPAEIDPEGVEPAPAPPASDASTAAGIRVEGGPKPRWKHYAGFVALVLAALGVGNSWWGRIPTSPKNCTEIKAEDCLALALKALDAKELEPARQFLQEAVGLGATKASLQLAYMYDPHSWSPDTSPAEKPDWELASYWYDKAAREGEREGMIGAGRLYCRFATEAVDLERGLELLRKASAQGDPGIQELIPICEAKSK